MTKRIQVSSEPEHEEQRRGGTGGRHDVDCRRLERARQLRLREPQGEHAEAHEGESEQRPDAD